MWREGELTIQSAGNVYGRLYDPTIKRSDAAHRVVWLRVYGAIPQGPDGKPLEVDHLCEVTLCQRPDHLMLRTKRDNVQRRGATRGPNKRASGPQRNHWRRLPRSTAGVAPAFAIALFERIDRPHLQANAVTLHELTAMLSKFQVLDDKRRGRC